MPMIMGQGHDLYVATAIIQLNNGACLRIRAFANFRPDREDRHFMPCQAVSRRKINKFIFILKKEKGISFDRWNRGVEHGRVCTRYVVVLAVFT